MAKEILEACLKNKTSRVLVDVRGLEGRLSTVDAYEIPTSYFPKLRRPGMLTKAAIVDVKEFKDSYQFFENVAVNRGYNLRMFGDIAEAIEWLH
jgi:hypothetical protein